MIWWSAYSSRCLPKCLAPAIVTAAQASATGWPAWSAAVFTPFIAAALVTFSGGSWHSVAIYLTVGCLLSAVTAMLMKNPPSGIKNGGFMREPHNAGCLPIRFNIGGLPIVQCDDPTLAEQPLFERARRGEAVAQLWQAPQGFVVPGSYRKFANLATVSESFAARGWPVWMRRSGGGLVPQGPGILNLSLARPVIQPLGRSRRTHLSVVMWNIATHAFDSWRRKPFSDRQRFFLRRPL